MWTSPKSSGSAATPMHTGFRLSAALLLIVATAPAALAQDAPNIRLDLPLPALEQLKKSPLAPSLQRLGPRRDLVPGRAPQRPSLPEAADAEATLEALPPVSLPVAGGLISLRIVLEDDADARAVVRELRGLGMQSTIARGRLVTGRLPVDSVPTLVDVGGVVDIRPMYAGVRAGRTTTQGDAAANADFARTEFGIDGTGVTIGAISNSFDCRNGATTDGTNGDLPVSVNVLDDSACRLSNSDEGRAMLQIAHDMAPGAALSFHTGFGGELDFAQGIGELAAAGADIIADDVFYYEEPFFQDGFIAQAARDVVLNDGVAFFVASGNAGRLSWEGAFSSSGKKVFSSGDAHTFGTGDEKQDLTLITGPEAKVVIALQWDDPYSSLDPASPGPDTDLDIALIDENGKRVAMSANRNIGSDPYEVINFINNTGQTRFKLVIEKLAGPDPGLMKYVAFRGVVSIDEDATDSGTVVGHANADLAMSIGAANYKQTPRFGISPPILAPTSSRGAAPILFEADGSPATGAARDNPDVTAPTGGNTTFFGNSDSDGDGFPNFFGTSAAVVHAAAVAALALEQRPELTPAAIETLLETHTVDIGAPEPHIGAPGFDTESGHGLVDAQAAIASLVNSPAIGSPMSGQSLSGSSVEFTWSSNDVTVDDWRLVASSTAPANGTPAADIFDSGTLADTATSVVATGLPTNGSDVHVTLEWSTNGVLSSETLVYRTTVVPTSLVVVQPYSWHMLGVPATSNQTLAQLFDGHLDAADYDNELSATPWITYRYDPELVDPDTGAAGAYEPLELSLPISSLDGGFWLLHLSDDPVSIDLPSDAGNAPGSAEGGCAPGESCVVTPLADANGAGGWQLARTPSLRKPTTDTLRLRTTEASTACEQGCTLADATSAGYSADGVWVFDVDGGSGGTGAYVLRSGTDRIEDWEGFWTLALPDAAQAGAELLIPVGE